MHYGKASPDPFTSVECAALNIEKHMVLVVDMLKLVLYGKCQLDSSPLEDVKPLGYPHEVYF